MENTTANPVGWDIVDTASDSTTVAVAVAVESEPVHIGYKLGSIMAIAEMSIMAMLSSNDPSTVSRGEYFEGRFKDACNLKVDYSRF